MYEPADKFVLAHSVGFGTSFLVSLFPVLLLVTLTAVENFVARRTPERGGLRADGAGALVLESLRDHLVVVVLCVVVVVVVVLCCGDSYSMENRRRKYVACT